MESRLAVLIIVALLSSATATETKVGPATIDLLENQALETLAVMYEDRAIGPGPITVRANGITLNPRLLHSVVIGPAQIDVPDGWLISYRTFRGEGMVAVSFPAFSIDQSASFTVPEGKKAVMFKNYTLGDGWHCGVEIAKDGRTFGRMTEFRGNEEFAGPCILKFGTGSPGIGQQDFAYYWSFILADNREPSPVASLPVEPGLRNLVIEKTENLSTWRPIGFLSLAESEPGFFRLRIAE